MMKRITSLFINLCAFWIILCYVLGFFWPDLFFWFSKGKWMTYALALVMLCMGLSLKFSDFSELFKQPKLVVLAAVSQYTVMPLTGWLVATAFGLPKQFAVGLIVLACCPGGAASNLMLQDFVSREARFGVLLS